ncbi:MAG TPA: hypothetical protein VGD59_02210 [Acidisarcina sp.]
MQMDWQETTALATFGLVISSFAAILYASKQLHHERAYRQMANLERQLTLFLSERFSGARGRLAEDRLEESRSLEATLKPLNAKNPPMSVFEVLDFYEHIALLIKKDHLDIYDVWHTFYEWLQPVYFDLLPILDDKDGQWFYHYSDLCRMMTQLDTLQKTKMTGTGRSARQALWTAERIVAHYKYELELGRGRRVPGGM